LSGGVQRQENGAKAGKNLLRHCIHEVRRRREEDEASAQVRRERRHRLAEGGVVVLDREDDGKRVVAVGGNLDRMRDRDFRLPSRQSNAWAIARLSFDQFNSRMATSASVRRMSSQCDGSHRQTAQSGRLVPHDLMGATALAGAW